MLGPQCIKTHRQTQDTIALSSGECQFYGIVKAATMGIGIKSLMEDLGLHVKVQVNTDSSAARSIHQEDVLGEFDTWRCVSCGYKSRSEDESCPSSKVRGMTTWPTA